MKLYLFKSFSQAILADKTLYVSGVLGLDTDARLVYGGAAAQARQALENLKHILESGGACLESVLKTTILLSDMQEFQAVNKVYAECKYLLILILVMGHFSARLVIG